MSASSIPLISPEEYLTRERAAENKSEYFQGRMYAMSGGTPMHSVIALNLGAALLNALRGTDCWVATSDLRLHVPLSGLYTYPDLAAYCGESNPADHHDDIFTDPIIIVEVLSQSTAKCDREFKFAQYRQLPSLQQYVLVSQWEPRIEILNRQPGDEFELSQIVGLDRECYFPGIDCRVAMSEIYRKVRFPE